MATALPAGGGAIATASAHFRPSMHNFPRSLAFKDHQPVSLSSVSRRSILIGPGLGILLASGGAALAEEEKYTVSMSGLAFYDSVVGFGPPPAKGALIKAHYTGKLENGTVFDSSYPRGKPLTFRVGVGEVIKGWDQGILGSTDVPPMLPGGKRKLVIPPGLGYGERGAGCRGGSCVIPPNAVLLFDVELLGKA